MVGTVGPNGGLAVVPMVSTGQLLLRVTAWNLRQRCSGPRRSDEEAGPVSGARRMSKLHRLSLMGRGVRTL
jgi:hypothetical protein